MHTLAVFTNICNLNPCRRSFVPFRSLKFAENANSRTPKHSLQAAGRSSRSDTGLALAPADLGSSSLLEFGEPCSAAIEIPQYIRRQPVSLNLLKGEAGIDRRLAPKHPGYERVELTIQFGLERVARHPFGPS